MKERYVELIVEVANLQQIDIITTSPSQGDNTLEDGFFEE